MLQITPQMRILVALEAVDGRKGIDGLAQLCREKLAEDPFSGCLFMFRSRSAKSDQTVSFDGQGFILAQKRLSKGRFRWWPIGSGPARLLEAYQAQLLFAAGNPDTQAAPMWRRVSNSHENKAKDLRSNRFSVTLLLCRQNGAIEDVRLAVRILLSCES